jgi:polyisoprenoid-binding protein YceI
MMLATVRGRFDAVRGTLSFDPADPAESSIEAVIETASLTTGVSERDKQLRGVDFLDVKHYPLMIFKSAQVRMTGYDTAEITGDLTIRTVTRAVTLKAEYLGQIGGLSGERRVGFVASGTINREDWGLTWNVPLETGGVLVSRDVRLEFDAEGILTQETIGE